MNSIETCFLHEAPGILHVFMTEDLVDLSTCRALQRDGKAEEVLFEEDPFTGFETQPGCMSLGKP